MSVQLIFEALVGHFWVTVILLKNLVEIVGPTITKTNKNQPRHKRTLFNKSESCY